MIDKPDIFADKYKKKSTRLLHYNYSEPGTYFITICTLNHNNFFGKIINGIIEYSKAGLIAKNELLNTIIIRKNILIDYWVIMPNHIHLLITIKYRQVETPRGASLPENSPDKFHKMSSKSKQEIPAVINQYKSRVTNICRRNRIFFAWQSRYFDEIIKDDKQLIFVQQYIKNNINNWQKDEMFRVYS